MRQQEIGLCVSPIISCEAAKTQLHAASRQQCRKRAGRLPPIKSYVDIAPQVWPPIT